MNLFKIDSRENKQLFVFPYGLDDLIIFCSCLKKYKDNNKDKSIFLAVLSPFQPGFNSPSYLKEYAEEIDFIEDVFEIKDVVVNKDGNVHVDKKRLEGQVSLINKYNNFEKIEIIEISNKIIKEDYRYNTYFQFCTLLGIEHNMPEYVLPKIESGCSNLWKKDYGIKKTDNYIVIQLSSRFENKKADKNLYDLVVEKINLPQNIKIVEVGSKEVEKSIRVSPDEVKTTTLIDIINGASLVICNNSLVYTISGILDKKTYCIINPSSAPIIRDFIFNFSKGNITYLATDATLEEWDKIRSICPFVQGNPVFKREAVIDIKQINLYNPTQKINRLNKKIFKDRDIIIEKLKKNEPVNRPVLWYSVDKGCLSSGGHTDGSKTVKFQLLQGLPEVLAYEKLGYKEIPVIMTNIFKPFY